MSYSYINKYYENSKYKYGNKESLEVQRESRELGVFQDCGLGSLAVGVCMKKMGLILFSLNWIEWLVIEVLIMGEEVSDNTDTRQAKGPSSE